MVAWGPHIKIRAACHAKAVLVKDSQCSRQCPLMPGIQRGLCDWQRQGLQRLNVVLFHLR